MSIHPSRLPAMAESVAQWRRDKGWYDESAPLSQATALLHEAVAEAGRAWRDWGLEDATKGSRETPGGHSRSKPEGVGSEFAGILIRWLDDLARFKLDVAISCLEGPVGRFGINENFMTNIDTLHILVSRLSVTAQDCFDEPDRDELMARAFAAPLVFLFQLADHYGIDLYAEYERKMRYNKDRPHWPYRHGGRRA